MYIIIAEKTKREIKESIIKVFEGNTNFDNTVNLLGKMVNNVSSDTIMEVYGRKRQKEHNKVNKLCDRRNIMRKQWTIFGFMVIYNTRR